MSHEIRTTFSEISEIQTGPKLQPCMYLWTCIQEATRMSPSGVGVMWREAAPGGLAIDNEFIPGGHDIGTSIYVIHHNETYFLDSFTYLPERWIPGSREEPSEEVKRAYNRFSLPISTQQWETQRDPGHLGLALWTSQVAFRGHSSSNDNNLLQSLLKVIERLGEGNENFEIPEISDVQGKWLGWRRHRDVNKGELAAMGERAKYEGMMGDVRSKLTIFFVHGGAY